MRLFSLGSGSSGNAFLLDTGDLALLIDCGVGIRTIQAAIRELGVEERLAGVVISHEHIDHVRAVDSLLRKVDCPVITTRGTYGAMRWEHACALQTCGGRHADTGLEIEFVSVSHDASEPAGFVVQSGGTRIAVFTDLGHADARVLDMLRDADVVVLEANYDPEMLRRGPYPAHLKRRISGPAGHLSNDDCASALAETLTDRTRAVWLAHLSDKNNLPAIAEATVREALALRGLTTPVSALPRHARAEITALPATQLSLGF